MTSRITLDLDGRVVHWDIEGDVAFVLAQTLVQTLGPAEEG